MSNIGREPGGTRTKILRTDHLLDQAAQLIDLRHGGIRRQANLRRAVSAAYYALFHAILKAAADMIVGKDRQMSPLYGLVYRKIDHGALRTLCAELVRDQPTSKYVKFVPESGWGDNLSAVCKALVDLQEARHLADYDPLYRVTVKQARDIVETAHVTLACFRKVSATRRRTFLTLLLFPPRA